MPLLFGCLYLGQKTSWVVSGSGPVLGFWSNCNNLFDKFSYVLFQTISASTIEPFNFCF